ncbi:MAG TPA: aminotransferase class IV [Lichenihabitans sp.]|nr:aminotransferase class IV [Lichenihabitans sp.]
MIWHNGALREGTTIALDAGDRGLLLGDGLFETVAVFNRTPFRLADHWDRMSLAADRLGIPLDRAVLDRATSALVSGSADDHGVLRITVTRGAGPRGLAPASDMTPTVLATLAPWRPDMAFRSVALATSSIRRNSGSPLSRIKSLGYLDNVLALREALDLGADDALLLNEAGSVACSSAANVFVVSGVRLLTPPIEDGVLPGITRALVLRHAAELGLSAAETTLTPADLRSADAAFLTNSVRLLDRVRRLDASDLGERDTEIVEAVSRLIADAVRRETGFGLRPFR